MNKREATARIYAGITVGELREVVRGASKKGLARLNRGLTKAQAADILLAAWEDRPDAHVVTPETYRRGRYRFSADAHIAQNILREFGTPYHPPAPAAPGAEVGGERT